MLSLPLTCQVWLCATPCDMRQGFDGLFGQVRHYLKADPTSGHLFVFVGRGKKLVKVLWWSPGGLSLYAKRLEEGCFRVPAAVAGQPTVQMSAADLAMLLDGIDWTRARRQKLYEPARSLATGGSTSDRH